MFETLCIFFSLAILIYSIVYLLKNRNKEGYNRFNISVFVISSILLLSVSCISLNNQDEVSKAKELKSENSDLYSEVAHLKQRLIDAKK